MSKRCVKLVIALDNLGLIWSGDRQVASSNDTFKENTFWYIYIYIYIYVLFAQLAAVQTGPFKAACSRVSDIPSRMEGSSRSKSFTWKDHDQRTPHIDLWWSVHPSCLCFWSESDHESSLEQLWKAIHTSTAAAFLEICCSTAALSLFSLSKCSWATKKRASSNFHVEIGATTALIIWRVGFWSFGELDSCKSLYCDPLRRCRRTRVRHTAAPPALRAVSLPKSLPGEKKLKGRKSRWNPLVRRVLFHHV